MNRQENIKHKYQARLETDVRRALNNAGVAMDVLWWIIEDFSDDFEEQTEAFFILFKELLR